MEAHGEDDPEVAGIPAGRTLPELEHPWDHQNASMALDGCLCDREEKLSPSRGPLL